MKLHPREIEQIEHDQIQKNYQRLELTPSILKEKTIHDTIEEFVEYQLSYETQRKYRQTLTDFFRWVNLEYREADLYYLYDLAPSNTSYDKMVFYAHTYVFTYKKVNENHPDRVLNPRTLRRVAYTLSSFFKHLISVYNYPKNPIMCMKLPKAEFKSMTNSLTRAEVMDMLQFVKSKASSSHKGLRDYILLCFLFGLALRRNEAAHARWDDINHSKQSITVFQKGGTYKELPLPHRLYELLLQLKEVTEVDSPYIFTPINNRRTRDLGKPISTNAIWKIVKKWAEAVMPEKTLSPHSFRKTFIEQALANKEDFISIINSTGHAGTRMIQYYDGRDKLENNAIHNVGRML